MRLIKAFGLAAIAATAAMAFVGASSAMATGNTALCNTNSEPCNSAYELLHATLTAGHVFKLHGTSPTINILCLEVLAEGHVLALGNPQEVHLLELNFSGCGTNSAHDNCIKESLELPILGDVLNEGGSLASLTLLNGVTLLICEVPFIGNIECEFAGAGLEFDAASAGGENGHGMVNSAGTQIENIGGPGSLCPDTSEIEEGLLEFLTDVYMSS